MTQQHKQLKSLPPQGHVGAPHIVAGVYYFGQGVAVDYVRAMAAYKIGAEGGDAGCQYQLGAMYYKGRGVDVDFKQAVAWYGKAAAQDFSNAVGQLGTCAHDGKGMATSWRRAREYYQRAIDLGDSEAVKSMHILTSWIQEVAHCPLGSQGAPSHPVWGITSNMGPPPECKAQLP